MCVNKPQDSPLAFSRISVWRKNIYTIVYYLLLNILGVGVIAGMYLVQSSKFELELQIFLPFY